MTERRDQTAHNRTVRYWCDSYERAMQAKYPFSGGKDGKTIKDLLAIYSEAQLHTFISVFFEMEDEFIQNSGYSLGVFRGCLPKVIAYVNRGQPRQVPKNLVGIQQWLQNRAVNE